jgi:hypothetical protein
MSHSMINSTNLKNILSRFFDKEFDISERMLSISEKFLFEQSELIDLSNYPELHKTLVYLKSIMERNNIKTGDDLGKYYDRKRTKMKSLFRKLEEVNPEECFALDFQHACTTYMKPIKEDHKFKNDCYYLQGSDECCTVEIHVMEQQTTSINTPYLRDPQEEIFMSRIKGNLLIHQEKKSCVSKKSRDAIVSN